MVQVTWPRWPPCPYIVKSFKNLLLWNKRPMILKLGLQHWLIESYQVCSNDDLRLTLIYFTARSNLVPYAFVWEKFKTMDFSETIVIYDIKVGRWSQLNQYMKLYEYQRSRSFIDLGPSHSDWIFSNIFSSITARPIDAKFNMALPRDKEMEVSSNSVAHMNVTKMTAMPI